MIRPTIWWTPAQSLPVAEVAGACFCCRFDDLINRAEQLQAAERPEVILAEPVGSCTDLVATVVQPLKDLYRDRFQVAPYPVLFKPGHGLPILRHQSDAGFSDKAAYIFRKQLEEADAIVINRIDELSPDEMKELEQLLAQQYPQTPVLKLSAKTGQGFEALTQLLDRDGDFGRRILDIDYDVYAEGEAELGWLNSSLHIAAPEAFALDAFLLDVIGQLRQELVKQELEAAHLKIMGVFAGGFGVANLVGNRMAPELSLPSRASVREADVIVNARVAADPLWIEEQVRRIVLACCTARGGQTTFRTLQRFRPGRPQPTHRYAMAK
jgi:hypothetical protein